MAGRDGARRLHKVKAMKSSVGLLAAAALFLGCGVGVDDPEGHAAAFGTMQHAIAMGSSAVAGGAAAGGSGAQAEGSEAQARSARGGEPQTGTAAATLEGLEVQAREANGALAVGGTVASPQDPIPAFDPLNPPNDPLLWPMGEPRPKGL